MQPIQQYLHSGSQEESNWRSVILFGKNAASYKFALAQALIDLAKQGKDSVTLEQLAQPYTAHLCEHVRKSPKQATSRSSKFIDACAGYADGKIAYDDLIASTVQLGFNNVLDAFHIVNQQEVPIRFFEKDFERGNKRIVLTDEAFKLATSSEVSNILQETESRWNLVETAWQLGVGSGLLDIGYDEEGEIITALDKNRRRNVTSARGALNGYQKGSCFYCFSGVNAADGSELQGKHPNILSSNASSRYEYAVVSLEQPIKNSRTAPLCDVDHFFPHVLGRVVRDTNFDGVWNLVLACPDCNRGEGGKFARIPILSYLERLHRRNEYLITSHHPLRETIIAQTGANSQERWKFLCHVDKIATDLLPGARWSTEQLAGAVF
ncbi:HNH endonuclease domain-containing protein [Eggerthella guodeyinii]|uniref:HNH endonuclease n=1 Tax=Eggerthella guodeyinii TaxID=2690837 RepID=A0A6N7RIN2_9ACTN|nr:HNH endonuclease domain-containing protein [Eggerthella guodeyinii]MRX81096.1 HNH endonuclease [Eggerthella guodeyinii]